MKVLREEPTFDESKLVHRHKRTSTALPLTLPDTSALAGSTSLYSLLQMEVAAEAAGREKRPKLESKEITRQCLQDIVRPLFLVSHQCCLVSSASSIDVKATDEAQAGSGAIPEEEDPSGKPRSGPYESDLEYLQDMFQLYTCVS